MRLRRGLTLLGALLCAGAVSCASDPQPGGEEPSAGPLGASGEPSTGLSAALLRGEEPRPTEREVVFLLDVSLSMPGNLREGKKGDFPAAVQDAQKKARELLEPYRGDEHLTVSFYRFGDIEDVPPGSGRGWRPNLRPVAKGISVAEAIDGIGGFFSTDSNDYTDECTYVASSVYEIAHQRLELQDPCDSIQLEDDKPLLTIFALTDLGLDGGGEAWPTCENSTTGRCAWAAENRRRLAWLRRQELSNALSYTHWDMANDNIDLLPPGEAVYRVQWVSKSKGQFNLADPDLDLNQRLEDFEPRVRMFPEAVKPSDDFMKEHPELVCKPREVTAIAASQPGRGTVDLVAEWRTQTGAPAEIRLDGLELVTSGRQLRPGGKAYDPATLRADLMGRLDLNIPVDKRPSTGDHSLRVSHDSLCGALTAQYPNSTFLLPPELEVAGPVTGTDCELPPRDTPYDLARIGTVSLVTAGVVPTYRFTLTGDAVSLDAPVVLDVDRWWRAVPDPETAPFLQERSVVLNYVASRAASITEPDFSVRYELHLLQDGEPVERFFDDVLSFGDRVTLLDGVPAGQPAIVRFPGRSQHWFSFGHGFPAGAHPGRYQAQICAQPVLNGVGLHHFEVSCKAGACGDGDASEKVTDEPLCATLDVEVGARPLLPWWWIAVLTALALAAAYATACWLRRQRFHEDLVVGTKLCRLRYEHEENRRYQPTRFIRTLLHALSWPKAGPIFYFEISHVKKGAVSGLSDRCEPTIPLLGIRPLADGAVAIWLVRADKGYHLILRNPGRDELPPCQCRAPDPFGKSARRVTVVSKRNKVRLDLEFGGEVCATVEFLRVPRGEGARSAGGRRSGPDRKRST